MNACIRSSLSERIFIFNIAREGFILDTPQQIHKPKYASRHVSGRVTSKSHLNHYIPMQTSNNIYHR